MYVTHVRKYHMCSLVNDLLTATYVDGTPDPKRQLRVSFSPKQLFGVTGNWVCVVVDALQLRS